MSQINYIKRLREKESYSISEIAERVNINWRTAKKYADGGRNLTGALNPSPDMSVDHVNIKNYLSASLETHHTPRYNLYPVCSPVQYHTASHPQNHIYIPDYLLLYSDILTAKFALPQKLLYHLCVEIFPSFYPGAFTFG